MTEFIFVGGKGGVGKSSISSAIALHLSNKGKVLLVSTDPVLALSDIWDKKLNNEPKKLKTNLFGKHINPDLFAKKKLSSPCASEKAALAELATHLLSDEYDYIIFDTAPTGHTLLLLKKPEEWREFMQATPLACGAEIGDKEKYESLLKILKSEKTSFVFVLIPELLSIMETQRAFTQLKEIGISRFNFIFNMFIPEEIAMESKFMANRHKMQIAYIQSAKSFVGCCPKMVKLQDSEISKKNLVSISEQIFEECCI